MSKFSPLSFFLYFVVLPLLIILAFYIRAQNLTERLWWDYDRSRDLLASHHIWKYKESPLLGHHAAGFTVTDPEGYQTVLKYPPTYYYYLSSFWSVGKTVENVLYINIALFSLSVISVYLIGNFLHGKFSGLLAAVAFTFSYVYTYQSWDIIGLQIGIPLYLLAFALYCYSIRKTSRLLNVLSLSLLIVGVTFHYSLLIPFIVLFFVSEFFFNKNFISWFWSSFVYGIYYVALFFFLHIPVIVFFGFDNFIQAFFSNVGKAEPHQIFIQFINLTFIHSVTLFSYFTPYIFTLSLIGLLTGIHKKETFFKIFVLLLLFSTLIFSGAIRTEIFPEQLQSQTQLSMLALLFLVSLGISLLLTRIQRRSQFFAFLVAISSLLLVGIPTSDNFSSGDKSYGHMVSIADYVFKGVDVSQITTTTIDGSSFNTPTMVQFIL